MRFTSLLFLAFFLCVYIAFWSGRRTRLPLLFIASFAFYAVWSIGFALHFLTIITLSHLLIRRGFADPDTQSGGESTKALGSAPGRARSRPYWLWGVLVLNFANLFAFKYASAAAMLFADMGLVYAGQSDPGAMVRASWPEFALVLPLAISFYTFQICAYAIDVARGQIPRDPGYLRFAVFILFFPQLVAGPIMRYHDFFGQLERIAELRPRLPRAGGGIYLLIQGFTKKLLIADNLLPATTAILFSPEQYDWQSNVAAVVGFAGQLYCDFSGYTDIARGLGKLLGLNLPENFFAPYFSATFRDFWRNWHRTLTTWLRDYVYIPLGGNRVSGARAALNTVLVLVLIGVWHGAGYNFFMLGLSNGIYLVIEGGIVALAARWNPGGGWGSAWRYFRRISGVMITLAFVCLVMVMMATPDFQTTLALYARIFALESFFADGLPSAPALERYGGIEQLWGGFVLALIFNSIQLFRDRLASRAPSGDTAEIFFATRARSCASLVGLWLLAFIFLILLGNFSPTSADFIYFQF